MGQNHSTRARLGASEEGPGYLTDRRGGTKVHHLHAALRESDVGRTLEPPPGVAGDELALLSAVVVHPGSSLDALRLRARLAPGAFADALRALSGASLITLGTRARADDPRAKVYPNPSGREVLAAAEAGAPQPAGRPPAALARVTSEDRDGP